MTQIVAGSTHGHNLRSLGQFHLARFGSEEAADDSQQCGFARTVRSGHNECLTCANGERQVREDGFAATFACQIFGFKPHLYHFKPHANPVSDLIGAPKSIEPQLPEHIATFRRKGPNSRESVWNRFRKLSI